MPFNAIPSGGEMLRFLPETILIVFGVLLMVLEPVLHRKGAFGPLALLALALGIVASIQVGTQNPGAAFQGMLLVDGFATYFRVLVMAVAFLVVLCSMPYLRRERHEGGEYYALILFSVVGQGVMVTANELIMVFIGLEISSIATYVLCAYFRDEAKGSEAALKYFLLGSFASAFLLYGIAWIYGLTGSTNLTEIRRVLALPDGTMSLALVGTAAALMFVGMAFKVSVAPFQIWTPDVYQGAPAPVTAFMSAGPKAAAFAIFFRVFFTAFGGESMSSQWVPLVWISALLTMIIGNFAALAQTNLKRLLAYSSIAHAGYIMVAVAARSETGLQAALFYLASYAFMNIGAFALIAHFSREGERYVTIDDLAGLALRQPAMAALLSVFLLSLIGVPLTGGFFAKFYVFKAALDADLVWLTILGLLNSAVAAYYYLKIIVAMYMRETSEASATVGAPGFGLRAVLWGSALAVLILGTFPTPVMTWAGQGAALVK